MTNCEQSLFNFRGRYYFIRLKRIQLNATNRPQQQKHSKYPSNKHIVRIIAILAVLTWLLICANVANMDVFANLMPINWLCVCDITQRHYERCMLSWQKCWTHVSWLPTCINVTRWLWENCSQFSLWEIVQSKPLRRCWRSSRNNLTPSSCVSSTSWNAASNSTSTRDWLNEATEVRSTFLQHCNIRKYLIENPAILLSACHCRFRL